MLPMVEKTSAMVYHSGVGFRRARKGHSREKEGTMSVSYTAKVTFDLSDPLKVQMVQSAIDDAFQKINFSPFETGKMPASAISVDVTKTSKQKS